MAYGVGQKGFADLQQGYSGQVIKAASAIKPTTTTKVEKEEDFGDIMGTVVGLGLAAYGAYDATKAVKPKPKTDFSKGFDPFSGVDTDTLLGVAQILF